MFILQVFDLASVLEGKLSALRVRCDRRFVVGGPVDGLRRGVFLLNGMGHPSAGKVRV